MGLSINGNKTKRIRCGKKNMLISELDVMSLQKQKIFIFRNSGKYTWRQIGRDKIKYFAKNSILRKYATAQEAISFSKNPTELGQADNDVLNRNNVTYQNPRIIFKNYGNRNNANNIRTNKAQRRK